MASEVYFKRKPLPGVIACMNAAVSCDDKVIKTSKSVSEFVRRRPLPGVVAYMRKNSCRPSVKKPTSFRSRLKKKLWFDPKSCNDQERTGPLSAAINPILPVGSLNIVNPDTIEADKFFPKTPKYTPTLREFNVLLGKA